MNVKRIYQKKLDELQKNGIIWHALLPAQEGIPRWNRYVDKEKVCGKMFRYENRIRNYSEFSV